MSNFLSARVSHVILVFLNPNTVTQFQWEPLSGVALNKHGFRIIRNSRLVSCRKRGQWLLSNIIVTRLIHVSADDLEWLWKAWHEEPSFAGSSPNWRNCSNCRGISVCCKIPHPHGIVADIHRHNHEKPAANCVNISPLPHTTKSALTAGVVYWCTPATQNV